MHCEEASKVLASGGNLQGAAVRAVPPPSEPATRPRGAERRADFYSLAHLFRPVIALVSSNHSTDSWMTKDDSNSDSKTTPAKDVPCNDAGHQNRGMVRRG